MPFEIIVVNSFQQDREEIEAKIPISADWKKIADETYANKKHSHIVKEIVDFVEIDGGEIV